MRFILIIILISVMIWNAANCIHRYNMTNDKDIRKVYMLLIAQCGLAIGALIALLIKYI